jgi:hypothetical protein
VNGVQQPVLVMTGVDETERAADGDLADYIEGVELHPGEQVECLLRFGEAGHCGHELAVYFVNEGLVHDEGAHGVQVGGPSAFLGMLRVASLGEKIFVCLVERTERAVVLGLAEFRTGAVDGADDGWVADAVAVWG